LAAALASCRGAFIGTALISGMSNILTLAGAMFMLEIYDRVLPSRSLPTLVGLVVLVAGLFTALGILDAIRGRILARIGGALDETLSGRVYDTLVRLPLLTGNRGDGLQPLRDLDAIRSYLSSLGPVALFDLPWIPLYLAICFAFHPLIGFTALGGAIILIGLTVLTEALLRVPTKTATEAAVSRNGLAETSRRNAEALTAMGMVGRIAERWGAANRDYMRSQRRASDVGGGLGAIAKVLRMMLQSGVLAVGAYLVIHGEATAGIDPERARAGASRSRHRPLEGIRRRPTELAQADPSFVGLARAGGTDAAGGPRAQPERRKCQRRAARGAKGSRTGRRL
jgi:ATP-binding cassette subfamily C protein